MSLNDTDSWFSQAEIDGLFRRYQGQFKTEPVSYATVADYCDSYDFVSRLAMAGDDLINVQRPWVLKAVLGKVARGGILLEMADSDPLVGRVLRSFGYQVHVVNRNSEPFEAELPLPPEQKIDCLYSISAQPSMQLTRAGDRWGTYLGRSGVSIHAVGHVHHGETAEESLSNLETLVSSLGLNVSDLTRKLSQVDQDVEAYFVSAEGHNRMRGSLSYDEFPMRVRTGIQLVSERP